MYSERQTEICPTSSVSLFLYVRNIIAPDNTQYINTELRTCILRNWHKRDLLNFIHVITFSRYSERTGMNKFIGMGRLVADPEYSERGETKIARYTLAVDRRFAKEDGTREADFLRIVTFGKAAEFTRQYLTKGMKILVTGRIQTSSYEKDGHKFYSTDIIAEDQEFCEPKKNGEAPATVQTDEDGFMNVPEAIDEDLPFRREDENTTNKGNSRKNSK